MASSSSEEFDHSIPEIIYECLSIISANSGRSDEVYVNCPLCKHPGKSFYCIECVKNGNFVHSKKSSLERSVVLELHIIFIFSACLLIIF